MLAKLRAALGGDRLRARMYRDRELDEARAFKFFVESYTPVNGSFLASHNFVKSRHFAAWLDVMTTNGFKVENHGGVPYIKGFDYLTIIKASEREREK